ncbi:MAG: TIGR04255 family protein, partial [Chloroflexi bacterium]|nr:TIGR04255 family protein [Chloroflexota bacterium]
VRTGFAVEDDPTAGLAFLLDFDLSRSDVRAFDVDGIIDAADVLHDLNLRLFQQAVTPQLLEALA